MSPCQGYNYDKFLRGRSVKKEPTRALFSNALTTEVDGELYANQTSFVPLSEGRA